MSNNCDFNHKIIYNFNNMKYNNIVNDNNSTYKYCNDLTLISGKGLSDNKNITFSGYKKVQVLKILEDKLKEQNIQESSFWSCELVASGLIIDTIEFYVIFYAKEVNINNPNLSCFFFEILKTLISLNQLTEYQQNQINLRNNPEIRENIFKLNLYLCLSKKNNIIELPIIPCQDFKNDFLRHKIKPVKNLISDLIKKEDPTILSLIGNQLLYSILTKNIMDCLYWISWIITWDKNNLKENKKIYCSCRNILNITPAKFNDDYIWLIWEIIFKACDYIRNLNITKSIKSLFFVYCYDYSKSKKNSKIYLIINSILFLVKDIDFSITLVENYSLITSTSNKIDLFYQEILNNYLQGVNTQISTHSNNIRHYSNENMNQFSPSLSEPNYNNLLPSTSSMVIEQSSKKNKKGKTEDNLSIIESLQKLKKVDEIFNQNFFNTF